MSKLEGLDELLANLSGLGGNIKESSRKGLESGAKKIQGNARMLAPAVTGQLRRSIKTSSEITEDSVKAKVFTNSDHSFPVEFGSGPTGRGTYPYKIKGYNPHYNAKKWRVKIPKVGIRYIAGQVSQPYMSPAYLHAKNSGEVEKEVISYISREIKKMERGKRERGKK